MKSALYSCPILIKLDYLTRCSKNPQTSDFIQIRPVGANSMRTDGQMYYNGDAGSCFLQLCGRARQNDGILYSLTNRSSAIRRQNNKA